MGVFIIKVGDSGFCVVGLSTILVGADDVAEFVVVEVLVVVGVFGESILVVVLVVFNVVGGKTNTVLYDIVVVVITALLIKEFAVGFLSGSCAVVVFNCHVGAIVERLVC